LKNNVKEEKDNESIYKSYIKSQNISNYQEEDDEINEYYSDNFENYSEDEAHKISCLRKLSNFKNNSHLQGKFNNPST